MKFFESHFTKHSFKRTPHKWLSALILSPIHHAEMRYKRHYHLKFAHAKKLFFIDMTLLCSTIVLVGATLFWWLYDPTVTALVDLHVTASVESERLMSGDDVTLTLGYTNNSDVVLEQARLLVTLPAGFVLSEQEQQTTRTNGSVEFFLDTIAPATSGSRSLSGTYYGPVGDHQSIQTMLIYTQAGRTTPESDVHRLLLSPRDSSVTVTVDGPERYLLNTPIPLTITLENKHDHTLPQVMLDLDQDGMFSWQSVTTSAGYISDAGMWIIPSLGPNERALLSGEVRITAPPNVTKIDWSLITLLHIAGAQFEESRTRAPLSIASPGVRSAASWASDYTTLGSTELLTITITNTGNISLDNPRVTVRGTAYPLETQTLEPGASRPISIPFPITQDGSEEGQLGPLFFASIGFEATIRDIPGYRYTTAIDAPPLPIGTSLSMDQSARYYTAEGDQLGRGPLPPRVGEETKYWIFTTIYTGIGPADDVVFTTKLAPGVRWTGKSSVSKGGDIAYNPATNTATWQTRRLSPNETVGLYYEVAVIPSLADRGTIPRLTTEARLQATDPYVDTPLSMFKAGITASLSSDPIGTAKGVVVQ